MEFLTTGLALLAQNSEPPLALGAKIESVWDFVVKGGPTMAMIAACSLVALAVIVERSVLLRRRLVVPPRFLSNLRTVAGDRSKALEVCQSESAPIARILAAVIRRRGQSAEALEKAVENVGSREVIGLRKRMRLLSALPQVSTMLGLLGTIFGMIKTFQAVAASGQALGKTELLAKGIFEAWTNTAAGLLVAIPVLIAYHLLMGRIDALAVEMDRAAADWIEREVGLAPAPRTVEIISSATSGVAAPAVGPLVQPAVAG